jgi:hypothetical protein
LLWFRVFSKYVVVVVELSFVLVANSAKFRSTKIAIEAATSQTVFGETLLRFILF